MKSILLTAIFFCAFEDMGETVDYKKTVSILTPNMHGACIHQ